MDYLGIASDLKDALSFYSASGGRGDPAETQDYNESARELMGKDQLRELAVALYQKIKENASIDWTIREDVRAKLKVTVKRLLRQYGYPPDMEALATETVLQQAEKIADELTENN